MNNYEVFYKKDADRRAVAAAKKINRSTGNKAGEQRTLSVQAVEAGLTDLSAACRTDVDLAKKVRSEARQALNSGDVRRYSELRAVLPRQMAQAI